MPTAGIRESRSPYVTLLQKYFYLRRPRIEVLFLIFLYVVVIFKVVFLWDGSNWL